METNEPLVEGEESSDEGVKGERKRREKMILNDGLFGGGGEEEGGSDGW